MRYCSNCHKTTGGEPLFCSGCGSTYDIRLCPRLHVNPRGAQVCTQCGSRDLSEPQPPTPFYTRWFSHGRMLWPAVLLELCSLLVLAAFVHTVRTNQPLQGQLLAVLAFLAAFWWIYIQLPAVLRRALSRMWRRKKDHGGHTD
jgi:hypothetical protein